MRDGRLEQCDVPQALYDYLYAPEQNLRVPHTDTRHTDGGREVFGGGGITPDVLVNQTTSSVVESRLLASAVCPDYLQCGPFFEFGKYYLGIHKTIPHDFSADNQVVQDFRGFLAKKGLTVPEKDLQANLDFIKDHIRTVLVNMIYGKEEAQHLGVQSDLEVRKAIEALPQAAALLDHARKFMASHPADTK